MKEVPEYAVMHVGSDRKYMVWQEVGEILVKDMKTDKVYMGAGVNQVPADIEDDMKDCIKTYHEYFDPTHI